MRISDWSSDVCSSDLACARRAGRASSLSPAYWSARHCSGRVIAMSDVVPELHSTLTCPHCGHQATETMPTNACQFFYDCRGCGAVLKPKQGDCCVFCSYGRSEEHTSELQSLMRISYAVFCLKKKTITTTLRIQ